MTLKPAHKILLVIAAVLLLSFEVFAFDIKVQPPKVAPGDVFYLKITGAENTRATVRFQDNDFNFYPAGDNRLIALVPVDISTKPKDYALIVSKGHETQTAKVTVRPHKFETISLTLPEGKVTLSPEDQERAAREDALLNRLWPQDNARSWDGRFTAPTDTGIATMFGVTRIMNKVKTSVHRGIDFHGGTGTPVKALNSGKVVLNDDLFFGGNTLIIDHGTGLFSVYMHLSKINVSAGESVSKGQTIGLIGMSGRATGPHLHLSVKLRGISINPESLFKLEL